MRRLLPLLPLLALLAAGCGGGPGTVRGPHSCTPQGGSGTMGACAPKPSAQLAPPALSGPVIPDVSEYQGHPSWGAAKGHISGAIARVADGSWKDADFAYNWRELRRLGIWHASYAFVRPSNCAGQGSTDVAAIRAQGGLDSGPLIADAEVPLPYSCVTQFTAAVEASTGWHVCVIYTAPGTWPGGTHDGCKLWVAGYGPSPGCVWTCSHVAWQYTDGEVGPSPRCVVGIGCGDLSLDTGISTIRRGPSPEAIRAAKRRSLRAHEAHRAVLHALIERHKCRPGQHARPASYHVVCGHWLAEGEHDIAVIAHYHREGIYA